MTTQRPFKELNLWQDCHTPKKVGFSCKNRLFLRCFKMTVVALPPIYRQLALSI